MSVEIYGLRTGDASEEPAYPQLDLLETPDEVVIEVDLPGVRVRDLSVRYLDGTVIIEGRKRGPAKGGVRYHCMERIFERFRRAVRIPVAVHAGTARATMRGGVLTLVMRKVTEKRGRPIPIPIETGE